MPNPQYHRELCISVCSPRLRGLPVRLFPLLAPTQPAQRALALLNDLGHVSREGLPRARVALHDVDVERAREGAEDVLAALGERTRHAPAAVRVAVQKADARTAKLRSKPRTSSFRRSAGMAWKVATVAPMLLGAARKVSTAKQHASDEGMTSKGRRKWRS